MISIPEQRDYKLEFIFLLYILVLLQKCIFVIFPRSDILYNILYLNISIFIPAARFILIVDTIFYLNVLQIKISITLGSKLRSHYKYIFLLKSDKYRTTKFVRGYCYFRHYVARFQIVLSKKN